MGGADESGWGISINTQGETIVSIVYFYDEDGKATWLIGSGEFKEDGSTQLNLLKTNLSISCNDNSIVSQHVGTLTLSLHEATKNENEENWATLEVGNSIWNRQQMSLMMFSNPQKI